MNRTLKVSGMALAFTLAGVLAQEATFAQPVAEPRAARPARIVGLWDAEVVVENCATGAPFGTFRALHKFELGGLGQVVPATNPAMLSAHLLTWEPLQRNHYRMVVKFFRFDATGANIGWTVLNNEITLSQDGNSYVGSGVAEVFDTAGNFLFSSCPSIVATRFTG